MKSCSLLLRKLAVRLIVHGNVGRQLNPLSYAYLHLHFSPAAKVFFSGKLRHSIIMAHALPVNGEPSESILSRRAGYTSGLLPTLQQNSLEVNLERQRL